MRKEVIVKNLKPLSILVCCSLVLLSLMFLQPGSVTFDFTYAFGFSVFLVPFLYAIAIGLCLKTLGFSFHGRKLLPMVIFKTIYLWVFAILMMMVVAGICLKHSSEAREIMTFHEFILHVIFCSPFILGGAFMLHATFSLKEKSHQEICFFYCLLVFAMAMEYLTLSIGSIPVLAGLYFFGYSFFCVSIILFLGVVFERIFLLLKDDHSQTNCKLDIRRY